MMERLRGEDLAMAMGALALVSFIVFVGIWTANGMTKYRLCLEAGGTFNGMGVCRMGPEWRAEGESASEGAE